MSRHIFMRSKPLKTINSKVFESFQQVDCKKNLLKLRLIIACNGYIVLYSVTFLSIWCQLSFENTLLENSFIHLLYN